MKDELEIPLQLKQEEALVRRLPKNHPMLPKILNSIEIRRAGQRGEQNVDYHLEFLPENKYEILRGIQLQNKHSFQIDKVLLSAKLIFIIEAKNYAGTLIFDKDSRQMIQRLGDEEKGYSNPLQQAQRQAHQLGSWLKKHKFPSPPIEYFIAISQPKTILKSNDKRIFDKVMHTEHLVNRINEIDRKLRLPPLLDEKTLRKIKRALLKESASHSNNILTTWNISPSEIIRGVICPYCSFIPMLRASRTWHCPSCKSYFQDAHIPAIKDFFLLIKPTITNKECREFLLIDSRRTAELILKSMNLESIGTTKGTFYIE